MIYIATNIHGEGIRHITAFNNRLDFLSYADQVTAMHSVCIRADATISDICEALYDCGIGHGARDHRRITVNEIKRDYPHLNPNC